MEDFIYMIGELYIENRRLRQAIADLVRGIEDGKEEIKQQEERWAQAEARLGRPLSEAVQESWQAKGSAQPARAGGEHWQEEVRQKTDGEDGREGAFAQGKGEEA
jgi:hypothetical protein